MKFLDKLLGIYKPAVQSKEYIVHRAETYHENPMLSTLSIEITAKPEVIEILRKQLVSSAYRTLSESTEWEMDK